MRSLNNLNLYNNYSFIIIILLAFSWPLYIVGFTYGTYPINLPLLLMFLLSIFQLLTFRVRLNFSFIMFLIWTAYVLFSIFFKGSKETSILSGIILTLLTFPLFGNYNFNVKQKRIILRFLLYGFLLSFYFLLVELIFNNLTGNRIQLFLSSGIAQMYVNQITRFGFVRPHSFFDEPAHYAIYLVFIYSLLDQASLKSFFQFKKIHKFLLILSLLLTQSLTGIFLFLSYSFLISPISQVYRSGRILKKLGSSVKLFAFLFGFSLLSYLIFPQQVDTIRLRIERTIDVFSEDDYRLEGARVNAYKVAVEFLESSENVLTGIGHGRKSQVVEDLYSHEGGLVANTFVNILITWGFFGLMIYVITIQVKLYSINKYLFWLIFLLHFILGFYISYMFWLPTFFIKILLNEKASIRNKQKLVPIK